PYLPKDVPRDPWGMPYLYTYPGTHGAQPDIVSYGADRQPGGEGINADVVSWDAELMTLPYRELPEIQVRAFLCLLTRVTVEVTAECPGFSTHARTGLARCRKSRFSSKW